MPFFPHASNPKRAELMACHRAVQVAQNMGVTKIVLETDCLSATRMLRSKDLDRSGHGPLVEDIKELLKSFEGVAISHVRRTGNVVAHRFAKVGCLNKLCNIWVEVLPDFVLNQIALDMGEE
jgi:ribonuclease HI